MTEPTGKVDRWPQAEELMRSIRRGGATADQAIRRCRCAAALSIVQTWGGTAILPGRISKRAVKVLRGRLDMIRKERLGLRRMGKLGGAATVIERRLNRRLDGPTAAPPAFREAMDPGRRVARTLALLTGGSRSTVGRAIRLSWASRGLVGLARMAAAEDWRRELLDERDEELRRAEREPGREAERRERHAEEENTTMTDATETTRHRLAIPRPSDVSVNLIDAVHNVRSPETLYAEDYAPLGASLDEHGQIETVKLLRLPEGRFRLLDGERRYRAAQAAGLESLRAEVYDEPMDEAAILRFQLTTFATRKDLSHGELAAALEEYAHTEHLTTAETARALGYSDDTVRKHLALRKTAPRVQELVEAGRLSLNKAICIGRLPVADQDATADACWRNGWNERGLAEQVARQLGETPDAGTLLKEEADPSADEGRREATDAHDRVNERRRRGVEDAPKKGSKRRTAAERHERAKADSDTDLEAVFVDCTMSLRGVLTVSGSGEATFSGGLSALIDGLEIDGRVGNWRLPAEIEPAAAERVRDAAGWMAPSRRTAEGDEAEKELPREEIAAGTRGRLVAECQRFGLDARGRITALRGRLLERLGPAESAPPADVGGYASAQDGTRHKPESEPDRRRNDLRNRIVQGRRAEALEAIAECDSADELAGCQTIGLKGDWRRAAVARRIKELNR